MKLVPLTTSLILTVLSTAAIGHSMSSDWVPLPHSATPVETSKVMMLCEERIFDGQQPVANGFFPALISLEDGNVVFKNLSGSFATSNYNGGIHPEGTRVSGYTWYKFTVQSLETKSLNFSLTYDNLIKAWGPGQLIVPGATTKNFIATCTALQELL